MIYLLGISAYYHDSAAALLKDGEVIAAAQEERFSRIKNDAAFPTQAIRYCLEEAGLRLDQLDAIVYYEKPFLKFERLLETYFAFAPRGFTSFVRAMPRWVKEQLLLKQQIRQSLAAIEPYDKKQLRLLFSEHHLSHAASAFYASRFEAAAILTIDGVGEWTTTTLGYGQGAQLQILKEQHFPHSLGLLYSAVTYFLGFRVNEGEYKLMGLSAYGNENSERFKKYYRIITETLAQVKSDGSLRLNQSYFSYAYGLKMAKDKQWENLFGFPRRAAASTFRQEHADLALAIQRFTEMVILLLAKEVKRLTGARYLCLAGGVALNALANGQLMDADLFDEIFIQPAAGDAGGAVGAALAAHHLHFGGFSWPREQKDVLNGALLGPAFSDQDIKRVLNRRDLMPTHFSQFSDLTAYIAKKLAKGLIVGWFQGRMEYGPRALGNRSILADARDPAIQQRLNEKIKDRESFRPFAPIVLAEEACRYFDLKQACPNMNIVARVKAAQLTTWPEGIESWSIPDKLAFTKSGIPAVTHVDGTARIQTVSPEANPKLYDLLTAFKELTGLGLLVNTSFNGANEPIVCTPTDAIDCFERTEMDLLVMGNYVLYANQKRKSNGAT